jgi:hypothetical protein
MELKTEADAISHKSKDGQEMGDLEFIGMRMMAIFDEFANFVKSEEYENIPNEHEKDDEESENTEESGKTEKNGKSKINLERRNGTQRL